MTENNGITIQQADQATIEMMRDLAGPLTAYLKQFNPTTAVNVLTYASTGLIMDLKMKPGKDRQEVLEAFLASVRNSVEGNMKMEAAEAASAAALDVNNDAAKKEAAE